MDEGGQRYGDLNLGELPHMSHRVDEAWAQLQQADRRYRSRTDYGLTARRMDEAQPAGERLYINAHRHLAVAHEHRDALWALLKYHGATPWAPWTLLRPIFEAAFHVVWALEPGDGLERRRRALRLEVQDHRQRLAYWKEWQASPEASAAAAEEGSRLRTEIEPRYRREAEQLVLTWDKRFSDVNIIDELKQLAVVRALPAGERAGVPATWRSLSGMSHGQGNALMRNSDLQASVPIPGGASAVFTVQDDAFESQGVIALWLLCEGCRLFTRRCTAP